MVDEIELRQLATTDNLTGAMSRRAFHAPANCDLLRGPRTRRELSCSIFDVDYFKSINDRHGHAIGNLALQSVVSVLKGVLRASDYIGRIGGEEFAIMLPETSRIEAFEIAERLRLMLQEAVVRVAQLVIRVTTSVGIATSMPSDKSIGDLSQRADEALYAAKLAGRNRWCALPWPARS